MFELLIQADKAIEEGRLKQAERTYWQLVELDPSNAIAVAGLARVSMERGDRRSARTFAERALAIDPDSVAAGVILQSLEDELTGTPDSSDRGESVEGESVEPDPSTPDGQLQAARDLEAMSRRRAAQAKDDATGGRDRKIGSGAAPEFNGGPVRERRQIGRLAAAAAAAGAATAAGTRQEQRRAIHHAMPQDLGRAHAMPQDLGRGMSGSEAPRSQLRGDDPFAAAESAAAIAAVDSVDDADVIAEAGPAGPAGPAGTRDSAWPGGAGDSAWPGGAEESAGPGGAGDSAWPAEAAAQEMGHPSVDSELEAVDATEAAESIAVRLALVGDVTDFAAADDSAELDDDSPAEASPTAAEMDPWEAAELEADELRPSEREAIADEEDSFEVAEMMATASAAHDRAAELAQSESATQQEARIDPERAATGAEGEATEEDAEAQALREALDFVLGRVDGTPNARPVGGRAEPEVEVVAEPAVAEPAVAEPVVVAEPAAAEPVEPAAAAEPTAAEPAAAEAGKPPESPEPPERGQPIEAAAHRRRGLLRRILGG